MPGRCWVSLLKVSEKAGLIFEKTLLLQRAYLVFGKAAILTERQNTFAWRLPLILGLIFPLAVLATLPFGICLLLSHLVSHPNSSRNSKMAMPSQQVRRSLCHHSAHAQEYCRSSSCVCQTGKSPSPSSARADGRLIGIR
jgi:hypothetical protein